MKTETIKTKRLVPGKDYDLFQYLDESIENLEEDTVLAVASKVVAICQGRVIEKETEDPMRSRKFKDELIKKEAELYHQPEKGFSTSIITIKDNVMQIAAGIDESNAGDYYILLPENIQNTTNKIRKYLREKFGLKNLGVLITDSRSTPLRRGVTGIALAYSGFKPIKSYIGEEDLFGRTMKISETNMLDSLASAAVLEMGEGSEQTPIVIINNIRNVIFQADNPSKTELKLLHFSLEEDLYFDLIDGVEWDKSEN